MRLWLSGAGARSLWTRLRANLGKDRLRCYPGGRDDRVALEDLKYGQNDQADDPGSERHRSYRCIYFVNHISLWPSGQPPVTILSY